MKNKSIIKEVCLRIVETIVAIDHEEDVELFHFLRGEFCAQLYFLRLLDDRFDWWWGLQNGDRCVTVHKPHSRTFTGEELKANKKLLWKHYKNVVSELELERGIENGR